MDVDIARVAAAEPGMNGVEVMTSESQERMLAIVRPDEPRRGPGAVPALGDPGQRDRPGDRHRPVPGLRRRLRREGPGHGRPTPRWPTCPPGAWATGRSTTVPLARPAGQDALVAADPAPDLLGRFPAGADLGPELLGLLGSPGVADSSWVWRQYDHQLFLNTVAGPGSDAAVLRVKETGAGPGPHHRREGPVLPPRPLHRRGPGRPRGRPQRGLRRRPARRRGQLPELREPGAPRGHVAVLRGGRRHVRRLPGARGSRGGRQRQLLQHLRRRGHPPHARGGHPRPDRPAGGPPPAARLAEGERIVLLGATGAEFGGSEWAMRHGLLGGPPPDADLEAGAALCGLVAGLVGDGWWPGSTTARTAAWPWRWRKWRSPATAGSGRDRRVAGAVACFSESASRVVLALAPSRWPACSPGPRRRVSPRWTSGRRAASRSFSRLLRRDGRRRPTAWRSGLPCRLGRLVGTCLRTRVVLVS